jgi:hypothetical protein
VGAKRCKQRELGWWRMNLGYDIFLESSWLNSVNGQSAIRASDLVDFQKNAYFLKCWYTVVFDNDFQKVITRICSYSSENRKISGTGSQLFRGFRNVSGLPFLPHADMKNAPHFPL